MIYMYDLFFLPFKQTHQKHMGFLGKNGKKTPTWRIIILHSHGISHFHGHLGFGLPPTAVILRGLQ